MSTACRTATPDGNAFCDGEDDATCDRDGLVEDIEQQSYHCGCRVAECKQGSFVADAVAEA